MIRLSFNFRVGLLLVLFSLVFALPSASADKIAGYDPDEALRLGERMYREGLLPSGEPMEALVQGDIPVDGTMFSCESCHLRAGLGSVEGTVITLPTNATELFQDFTKAPAEALPTWPDIPHSINPPTLRPAYDDKSLAHVLWTGVDPGGRELSETMPRYHLEDRDMAVLIHYLRGLAAKPSPGVNEDRIVLATVVAGDVPEGEANAMVEVLQAYVKDRNTQTRRQEERALKGVFYRKHILTAWRRLELKVWRVTGPAETWQKQLADNLRKEPVFALIGGIAAGDWRPIHEFCEREQLPAMLPLTDQPVVSEKDWYTLYFSKGDYQEGEAVARYLSDTARGGTGVALLQDSESGSASSLHGFEQTWETLGLQPLSAFKLQELVAETSQLGSAEFVVCAVSNASVKDVLALVRRHPDKTFVFFYSSADQLPSLVPVELQPRVLMAYPYRLPEDEARYQRVVNIWLKARGLKLDQPRLQSKAYFVGWMLSGVLMHLRSDYYRDHMFDALDMMNDETYGIAIYPLLSFGHGQRYASKGCYLVKFTGDDNRFEAVTDWIIH